jgi:glycosyltransferase involved in cell wall biosynthesis
MRILLTADTVGGVWTYAQELVTGLVRRGIEVTLVSFGEMPELSQMRWTEGLHGVDFRPTPFRLEWMQDVASDIEVSSEYLLNIIRETRPDLLHFSQYCYGSLPVDIPKIVTAHSDVVSWWQAVHGEDPPVSEWTSWYRQTVTRGLHGADAVIAPSRWMLSQIEQNYGVQGNSTVIHNGRTAQHFNSHAEKQDRVVSIGRLWDEAKQVSLLAESGLTCPVTIAGTFESPEQRHPGAESVIRRSIELRDKLTSSQVRTMLADACIYAATSRYEPFGLAPLEAALSRCALVANDIPTFRELWGPTALYFATNDAAGLRAAVQQLRSDPSLRRHYSELAYQRARRLFSAEAMVDEYLAVYRSLVPERSIAA